MDYQYSAQPDVHDRQHKAPDYLYHDARADKRLVVEITRIVDTALRKSRSECRRFEEIRKSLQGRIVGSFILSLQNPRIPPRSNKGDAHIKKLASDIKKAGDALSVGAAASIERGMQLIKHSSQGASLVIIPSMSLSDKSDNPLYVKDFLMEADAKFKSWKNADCQCILVVLSLGQNWRIIADVIEAITRYWDISTALINVQLSGPVVFSSIDTIYVMEFDFSWDEAAVGLAQCYPSRHECNLCHPEVIFRNYREYRNMLLSYFFRL